ncbi:MAG: helix-turn-helix transcriptional regulator [Alphaproteobacteria bacterium]|nr:helix-turn-helix transcriptional regulator [Alphaproteobacteria bacterium]
MNTDRIYKNAQKGDNTRESILAHALALSHEVGYEVVTRNAIAERAGCSGPLISMYFGGMRNLRKAIMREAIKHEDLAVIAQGLAAKDKEAQKASAHLKMQALATLIQEMPS